jgi:hypothetical protein
MRRGLASGGLWELDVFAASSLESSLNPGIVRVEKLIGRPDSEAWWIQSTRRNWDVTVREDAVYQGDRRDPGEEPCADI